MSAWFDDHEELAKKLGFTIVYHGLGGYTLTRADDPTYKRTGNTDQIFFYVEGYRDGMKAK